MTGFCEDCKHKEECLHLLKVYGTHEGYEQGYCGRDYEPKEKGEQA